MPWACCTCHQLGSRWPGLHLLIGVSIGSLNAILQQQGKEECVLATRWTSDTIQLNFCALPQAPSLHHPVSFTTGEGLWCTCLVVWDEYNSNNLWLLSRHTPLMDVSVLFVKSSLASQKLLQKPSRDVNHSPSLENSMAVKLARCCRACTYSSVPGAYSSHLHVSNDWVACTNAVCTIWKAEVLSKTATTHTHTH